MLDFFFFSFVDMMAAKCRENESKAAVYVRHECASKQQLLGPDPCAKRACDIRGRALMNRPPEVVWNTHYCLPMWMRAHHCGPNA